MEIVSEKVKKQDGEKYSFVFFRDQSYIGWEGLFIGSQNHHPILSLMYELMRVLIIVLLMIYVYKIPDDSIHCKTLNPERLYCVMLNPGWHHSFQKPFVYNKSFILCLFFFFRIFFEIFRKYHLKNKGELCLNDIKH